MNRRAFLRGLLASGAVVVVAPVVTIAPSLPSIDGVYAERIRAAYAIALREIEHSLFENAFGYSDFPPQWQELFDG